MRPVRRGGGVLRWLTRRGGSDRQAGLVEAGVAVTGLALVLGAAVGSGVASTAVTMSDGSTWLPDDATGQVLQVNPATGQVERRLQVSGAGGSLRITQRDGTLLVGDDATGVLTSIDLATLLAGGQRADGGTLTRVLVGGGSVFLVDLAGTVRAVDPLTLRDLGAPYRTDALADAVVDDAGTVWLVGRDGTLEELAWSAEGGRFTQERSRALEGAGPRTRMVPHARGVSVFSPDGGTVAQVGAGRDLMVVAATLDDVVLPALTSPATLSPVSSPSRGTVMMISGGALLAVDVGALGCARPSTPAVFTSRVYVPCDGTGHVVVLDQDGRRAGPDIIVPGGLDPRLVVDDGRLVAYAGTSGGAVVVEADGSTRQVETGGGRAPVQDVNAPPVAVPPVLPPPGPTPGTQPPDPGRTPDAPDAPDTDDALDDVVPPGQPPQSPPPSGPPTTPPGGPGSGDDGPGSGGTPTTPPTLPPTSPPTTPPTAPPTLPPAPGGPEAPTAVQGVRSAPGTATVTWRANGPAAETFVVRTAGATAAAVTVDGSATEATVAGLPCEARVTFTVEAVLDGQAARSSASRAVAMETCPPAGPTAPTAATGVTATAAPDGSVTVAWSPASSGADSYAVSPVGGSATQVAGTATSVTLVDVPAGAGVRFVVQTRLGAAVADSAPSNAVTVAGPPGAPGGVAASVTGRSGDVVTVAVSFTAAPDNGSPVQGYTVQYSGGGVAGRQDVAGAGGTSLAVGCAGRDLCTVGGTLQVTVAAHNGVGSGPAGSASATVAAPPPPPPASGDGVVDGVDHLSPGLTEEQIPMVARLSPPPGWAAHAGGCELVVTPTSGAVRTWPIACSTSGQVSLGAFDGGSQVTVAVRALGLDVTSAAVTGEVPPRNWWAYCRPDGMCTDPVSVPTDPDGGTVTIVPLPWTPVPGWPGGPAPEPFVLAGVGLLGAAGALRAARLRDRGAQVAAAPTSTETAVSPEPAPDHPLEDRR